MTVMSESERRELFASLFVPFEVRVREYDMTGGQYEAPEDDREEFRSQAEFSVSHFLAKPAIQAFPDDLLRAVLENVGYYGYLYPYCLEWEWAEERGEQPTPTRMLRRVAGRLGDHCTWLTPFERAEGDLGVFAAWPTPLELTDNFLMRPASAGAFSMARESRPAS